MCIKGKTLRRRLWQRCGTRWIYQKAGGRPEAGEKKGSRWGWGWTHSTLFATKMGRKKLTEPTGRAPISTTRCTWRRCKDIQLLHCRLYSISRLSSTKKVWKKMQTTSTESWVRSASTCMTWKREGEGTWGGGTAWSWGEGCGFEGLGREADERTWGSSYWSGCLCGKWCELYIYQIHYYDGPEWP